MKPDFYKITTIQIESNSSIFCMILKKPMGYHQKVNSNIFSVWWDNRCLFSVLLCFFKDFIYLFLEGKGGRKRRRETVKCEQNVGQLPIARPQQGTWPATQACAATGNQTSDLLLCRVDTQPTEPHQSGQFCFNLFLILSRISLLNTHYFYYFFYSKNKQ